MPRKRKMKRGTQKVSFRQFKGAFNRRFKEEVAYHIEMPTEEDLKEAFEQYERSGLTLQQWLDEGVLD